MPEALLHLAATLRGARLPEWAVGTGPSLGVRGDRPG
jgi:hypothetical protein